MAHVKNPIPNYDCTNPFHVGKVVGDHGLFKSDFDQYIKNFIADYGLTSTPKEKMVLASDIQTALSQGTCRNSKIKVWTGDEGDENSPGTPDTNEDIYYRLDTSSGAASAYYSYALFRGVLEIYKPDTFHFYKAKKDGDLIFVFKAIQGGTTLYLGDLSELYP